MLKTLIFTLILLWSSGCGRTADSDSEKRPKSSGKLEFITVEKSHFVAGDMPGDGHYQTIIRTLNKPKIYAQNDALENYKYYSLYENNKHKEESIIGIEKSNNEIESDVMLLLDLSGSIIEGGCNTEGTTCNQLIHAAHAFVNNIITNGNFKISIYYFNAKREIAPLTRQTEYPTSNVDILNQAINRLKDSTFIEQYLKGYENSTNLYGAVIQSGEKVCSWINCESTETFKMGAVVIFTDGRDLADLVSKKKMLKSLKKNIQYYTIGIGNADNKTLIEISGKDRHFEASENNIEDAFSQTYNYILYNSSFYRVNYCPSTREGTVRVKIFFNDTQNHIRAYTEEDKITIPNSDIRCDIIQ
ncbi:MAG: hypothetical protein DSZ05_03970 [Sulfurospirillum sp.]|nr:MAG: hypothetical protein DSZ05_03970 [Sulfurospirillum sp.]